MNLNQNPNNQPVDPARRGFLKKSVSIAGAALAGIGTFKIAKEITREEHAMTALHEKFSGKQESFAHVVEAATLLSLEMKREELSSVTTAGGNYSSNELVELRDFLTAHMSSKVSSRYGKAREQYLKGFYTEGVLEEIQKEAKDRLYRTAK